MIRLKVVRVCHACGAAIETSKRRCFLDGLVTCPPCLAAIKLRRAVFGSALAPATPSALAPATPSAP